MLRLRIILAATILSVAKAAPLVENDFDGGQFVMVRVRRNANRAMTFSGFNPNGGMTAFASSADFPSPYFYQYGLSPQLSALPQLTPARTFYKKTVAIPSQSVTVPPYEVPTPGAQSGSYEPYHPSVAQAPSVSYDEHDPQVPPGSYESHSHVAPDSYEPHSHVAPGSYEPPSQVAPGSYESSSSPSGIPGKEAGTGSVEGNKFNDNNKNNIPASEGSSEPVPNANEHDPTVLPPPPSPKKGKKKKPVVVPEEDSDDEDADDQTPTGRSNSRSSSSFNAWFPIMLGMYPGSGSNGPTSAAGASFKETDGQLGGRERAFGTTIVANSVSNGKNGVAHAIAYGGSPAGPLPSYGVHQQKEATGP